MDTLLTNMKMSKEEAKEQTEPTASDAPEYPWGLSINLNDDSLEKLGLLKNLPAIGSKILITALADVSTVSSYKTQAGEDESSVSLQITDMQVSAAPSGDRTSTLYDNTRS
jgi:hypothetical protein